MASVDERLDKLEREVRTVFRALSEIEPVCLNDTGLRPGHTRVITVTDEERAALLTMTRAAISRGWLNTRVSSALFQTGVFVAAGSGVVTMLAMLGVIR